MQIEEDIVKITGRIVEFVIGEKQLFLATAGTVLAGTRRVHWTPLRPSCLVSNSERNQK